MTERLALESIISQSRPIEIAVSILSPVAIIFYILQAFNFLMVSFDRDFSLFTMKRRPMNVSSSSTVSSSIFDMLEKLLILTFATLSFFAKASTLSPWDVASFRTSSKLVGSVSFLHNCLILSGEPLTHSVKLLSW